MFSTTVAAALVALPFVANSVLANDCVRSYTIQEGDICNSISAAKGVSTYQLATINEGYIDEECSNLEPGATICLGYENEDCTETHTVVADDTCEAITEKYSIDLTTLYNSNPNINGDCSNIYIGEVLAVCSEVIIPPAGSEPPNTQVPSTATLADTPTAVPTRASFSKPPADAPAAEVSAPASTEEDQGEDYEEDNDVDDNDESLPYCDEL